MIYLGMSFELLIVSFVLVSLCCICAVPIKANAANMCVSCLKGTVDVTEGIPKEIIMHQCRGCLK
jgi:nonsense-mediated mRNA decay protein 3